MNKAIVQTDFQIDIIVGKFSITHEDVTVRWYSLGDGTYSINMKARDICTGRNPLGYSLSRHITHNDLVVRDVSYVDHILNELYTDILKLYKNTYERNCDYE